jgi:hypothetical protein
MKSSTYQNFIPKKLYTEREITQNAFRAAEIGSVINFLAGVKNNAKNQSIYL